METLLRQVENKKKQTWKMLKDRIKHDMQENRRNQESNENNDFVVVSPQ